MTSIGISRAEDRRLLRAFRLPNELEVLLISDPDAQKSAASLDVNVGSLEDPDDHPGLAHFLEHMLFLGTEKYSDVEEYRRYLRRNQGAGNAFTADEHTNYHFGVTDAAFAGALDRFAQFFISPLFNPELVQREMNAVDSEHRRNLHNEFRRKRRVQRSLHRTGHPRRKFSTGNLSTLAGITREKLMAFHERHYSANAMKLCVISKLDRDTLQEMVTETFSPIENRRRSPLVYPSDVFDERDLPRIVTLRPVADVRALELWFALPPLHVHYRAKPAQFLAALIGHEGEGSLLSRMKREMLITSLSAGAYSASYCGFFEVRCALTTSGLQNIDRVIELFFAEVELLRREGLAERYFRERQVMSELDYRFRDHQEGAQVAVAFASAMHDYPALEVEARASLFLDYDPDAFRRHLDHLRPELTQALLASPDAEADRIEPYYEIAHAVRPIPAATVERWRGAAAGEGMHGPLPNPFIPGAVHLVESDSHPGPRRLIDDERGILWFEQDRTFKLPKARMSLVLVTPEVNRSARDRVLAELYSRCVAERLAEWSYPVAEAGLQARLEVETRGIRLLAAGYADRLPALLDAFTERLAGVRFEESAFRAIREDLQRECRSVEYEAASRQILYEIEYLLDPALHHRRQYAALVEEATLDEVQEFAARVYRRSAIEGVACGNLNGNATLGAVDNVLEKLGAGFLPRAERSRPIQIQLPPGQHLAHRLSSRNNNHCWMRLVQFGPRSARREAIIRLGASHLNTPFHTEMRTRQQLGYTVFSGARLHPDWQGVYFLIQSAAHPADDLARRAGEWIARAIPDLAGVTSAEFESLQRSTASVLRETDRNLAERAATIEHQALRLGGDFDWRPKVAEEVEKVTRKDLIEEFRRAFVPDRTSSLSLYVDAEGAGPSRPTEPIIEDLEAFRRERPVF